jgi:hypothetical protein
MVTFAEWSAALAKTESNDNPKSWGDEGLACGRWQMHPAFVWQWMPKNVGVRWSWDHVFTACLEAFYHHYMTVEKVAALRAAMIFHLGAAAVESGDWDAEYEKRFTANRGNA